MRCPNRPRGFGKTPPSGGGGAVPTAGGNAAARRRRCRCSPAGSAVPTAGEKCRRPAAGGLPVFTGGNKRGQGHRMVPLPPLDSPKPSFKPRLPSVARLKARGPQGRLVLQDTALDGSGAFRSGTPPPCTGWPRTVMRGKSRKVNSGHKSVT